MAFSRPFVRLIGNIICSGESGPIRVVLTKDKISMGYTDTTPETLEYLLAEHRKAFPPKVDMVILQEGQRGLGA